MNIVLHQSVEKFIKHLDRGSATEMLRAIELLGTYGHLLSMPHTKPVGGGLWELRIIGKRPLRILYGFCKKEIVLVSALKKQRPALLPREIKVAGKRLEEYCVE